MKINIMKALLISLGLTIGYVLFAILVFRFGASDSIIGMFVALPVIIIWGYGYGGGNEAALPIAIILFLIMWVSFFVLTTIVLAIIKSVKVHDRKIIK